MADMAEGRPPGRLQRGIAALAHLASIGCEIILLAMLLMMAAEVVVRNVFGFSFQVTDELSGYLLVALTFLALGVSLQDGAFFRVEFLFERLPRRTQAWLTCLFTLASLLFAAILDWQLIRLVQSSFRRGNVEPSLLATPLWIPQAIMPVGMTLLILVLLGLLLRQIGALRADREPRP